jgi:hypothetical protein
MIRRFAHIVCSLWLVATSLAPGHGWTLCFEASGQVTVEITALGRGHTSAGAEVADCATDCPPERCEDCRHVSLCAADRACPRRDMASVELAVLPACVEMQCGPLHANPRGVSRALAAPAAESPHLIRVLRC